MRPKVTRNFDEWILSVQKPKRTITSVLGPVELLTEAFMEGLVGMNESVEYRGRKFLVRDIINNSIIEEVPPTTRTESVRIYPTRISQEDELLLEDYSTGSAVIEDQEYVIYRSQIPEETSNKISPKAASIFEEAWPMAGSVAIQKNSNKK